MFSYLMGIVQEFERNHGRRPQAVCLNPRHMQQFMDECPDLFERDTYMPLGFRIVILPESELPHPKALWLPPRRQAKPGLPKPNETKLLAWTPKQRHRDAAHVG